MQTKRQLKSTLAMMLIVFMLAGCNGGGLLNRGPVAGHYEGDSGVSFDVTADGLIQNFTMYVSFGMSGCRISQNTDETITIGKDGSFVISGQKPDSAEEQLSMNTIIGRFDTPTTVSGEYANSFICGDNMILSTSSGVWSAGLTEDQETPTGNNVIETIRATGDVFADRTQELLIREITVNEPPYTLVFTPDGNSLLSGLGDGTFSLTAIAEESNSRVIDGLDAGGAVFAIAFSPDGTLMACGAGATNNVTLVNTSDWSVRSTLDVGETYSVAFSPDNKLIATGRGKGQIYVWQVSDGSMVISLVGHEKPVNDLAFSPDSLFLASDSIDDSVRIWQISDGSLFRKLEPVGGSSYGVFNRVAFLDNGRTIAALHFGSKSEVYFWSVSDGALLRTIDVNSASDIGFSPDGKLIASVNHDGNVQLWDISSGGSIAIMQHPEADYISFSPDGTSFVTYGYQNLVRVWNAIMP